MHVPALSLVHPVDVHVLLVHPVVCAFGHNKPSFLWFYLSTVSWLVIYSILGGGLWIINWLGGGEGEREEETERMGGPERDDGGGPRSAKTRGLATR